VPTAAAPKRKAWPWVALAVVVVALAVAIVGLKLLTGTSNATPRPTVATSLVHVPSVIGMPLADAENEIQDAGLQVGTISSAPSRSVADGDVISTNPPRRTRVRAGSAVSLVVSAGLKPAASHVPGRHGHSPSHSSARTSSPPTGAGSPAPQSPSPSPSSSCIVRLIGICI
jgi:serine/threonine-protein kinase